MFEKYLQNYRNFPKEIWILALMTFINRAGTMVIPFLSKYLNESLHFTYSQIGWVLVFFGIGSIIGTWISGKLSDIFGFYKVMVFSLFATGLCFFALQFITSFIGFCIAILVLTSIADMYRPAMLVSLNSFTKKTNRTRALTLIRSAINLGFLFGPAIAGLIIMNNGYSQLFFIDGATCILAVSIFAIFIKERKLPFELKKHNIGKDYYSVIKDKPFLIHLLVTTITGILFFQIFTILPIYYKYQYNLTDFNCGLLLSFNGLLILIFELPLVNYIEINKIDKLKVIIFGLLFMIFSFATILIIKTNPYLLILMMFFMSFGVMLTFPFSSIFAMSRTHVNQEGKYMSLFTMSYSIAHILGAKISLAIIENYNYNSNWTFLMFIGFVAILLTLWIKTMVQKENEVIISKITNSLFKNN